MKIDRALVEHVARLARLKLSEKEIVKFLPELKEILGAFSKISEVDTENIESSFHPVELKNFMREDEPEESLTQSDSLALATHNKDGYFKGPRVV